MANEMQVEIFYDDRFAVVHGLDEALARMESSTMDKRDLFHDQVGLIWNVAIEMARIDQKQASWIIYFDQLARQVREKIDSCDQQLFDDLLREFFSFVASNTNKTPKATDRIR